MVLYRADDLIVVEGGVQQVLDLGFVPDIFRMRNTTILSSGTLTGVTEVYWDRSMGALATPRTSITTMTTGVAAYSSINSGTVTAATGVVPYQTPDNQLFVPQQAPYNSSAGNRAYIGPSTLLVITALSQAVNASVTATHSFTSDDIGVTVVTFHGVPGMTQINGLSGIIQSVTSTTSFTVNINSTNFTAYDSSGTAGVDRGFANVITGAPVNTLYGNQLLPTALENLGVIGLVLGTTIMVNTSDVWFYEAILQSPATGP